MEMRLCGSAAYCELGEHPHRLKGAKKYAPYAVRRARRDFLRLGGIVDEAAKQLGVGAGAITAAERAPEVRLAERQHAVHCECEKRQLVRRQHPAKRRQYRTLLVARLAPGRRGGRERDHR